MTERGTVIEVKGGKAVVEIGESRNCGSCRACEHVAKGKMELQVHAPAGLCVGDRVEVEVPVSKMTAVVTVFVVPMVALVLGALLGNWLSARYYPHSAYPGLLSIGLALAFVLLSYVGVYLFERKAAAGRKPPTIRKVDMGKGASQGGGL